MAVVKLIADSGATKSEWCLLREGRKKTIFAQGISPYFLNTEQIVQILLKELTPKLKKIEVNEVFYYGTGCINKRNAAVVKKALHKVFPASKLFVTHDMMGAARALCGHKKGIASILGTGSSCCFYNGRTIGQVRTGLGYVLGDEGSGAYLGKKVLQYYLYDTFDEDLRTRFNLTFTTNVNEILENIYKKPLPNRYLASFTSFLVQNRGHFMIENIIEDGLNDFFFNHLCKFRETWTSPIHFAGSVAYGFKDVLQELCHQYEFELGRILKNPMDGLIEYHS